MSVHAPSGSDDRAFKRKTEAGTDIPVATVSSALQKGFPGGSTVKVRPVRGGDRFPEECRKW